MLNAQQSQFLELVALHGEKLAQRCAAGQDIGPADVTDAMLLAAKHSAALQMGKQRASLNEKVEAANVAVKNIVIKRESLEQFVAKAERAFSLDMHQRLTLDQAQGDLKRCDRDEREARETYQRLREQYEKTEAARNAILAQLEQA